MPDMVNSPPHYADGRRFEVIDVIEDSVKFAPSPILGGLQWQVLKYVHRCWNKDTPQQDLQKAMWYLMRLVDQLEARKEFVETSNG
jgi:hypothetical protein